MNKKFVAEYLKKLNDIKIANDSRKSKYITLDSKDTAFINSIINKDKKSFIDLIEKKNGIEYFAFSEYMIDADDELVSSNEIKKYEQLLDKYNVRSVMNSATYNTVTFIKI